MSQILYYSGWFGCVQILNFYNAEIFCLAKFLYRLVNKAIEIGFHKDIEYYLLTFSDTNEAKEISLVCVT